MAMKATASAKAMAIIIAMKILGAAEGLRPRELMLAKELAAKTAHGPKIQARKIIARAILRVIVLKLSLQDDRYIVLIDFYRPALDVKKAAVDIHLSPQETGHHAFVERQYFKNSHFPRQCDTFSLAFKNHLRGTDDQHI